MRLTFLVSLPLLWLSNIANCQTGSDYVPIYSIGGPTGSFSDYVDKDGYVNPLVDLGEINFKSGLTLPLVLSFSSDPGQTPSAFGKGWGCQLFDSSISNFRKKFKKVIMLGGKQIFLCRNSDTGDWKHYYSDNWAGKEISDGFTLIHSSGAKFIYRKGLISELFSEFGRNIQWRRLKDKLVELGEKGKPPTLLLLYNNTGAVSEIKLYPADPQRKLDFYFSYEPVDNRLNKISCSDGRQWDFAYSEDATKNSTIKMTCPSHLPLTFTWNQITGKIVSDGIWNYQIRELSKDYTFPEMLRSNLLTGHKESFYYEPDKGYYIHLLPDGTVRKTYTILKPGRLYKKIRLIEDIKKDGTHLVLQRWFDSDGRLLGEIINLAHGKQQTRQFQYNSQGQLLSYLFNGDILWQQSSSNAQQWPESFLTHTSMTSGRYDRQDGGGFDPALNPDRKNEQGQKNPACFTAVTDYKSSQDDALFITRTHNDSMAYAGPLGQDWDFNYNRYLEFRADAVYYHTGMGTKIRMSYTGKDFTQAKSISPDDLCLSFDGTQYRVALAGGKEDTFDEYGRLVCSTDEKGRKLEFTRDLIGRLIKVENSSTGCYLTFETDDKGRIVSITDGDGSILLYTYDKNYRLLGSYRPDLLKTHIKGKP